MVYKVTALLMVLAVVPVYGAAKTVRSTHTEAECKAQVAAFLRANPCIRDQLPFYNNVEIDNQPGQPSIKVFTFFNNERVVRKIEYDTISRFASILSLRR